MNTARISKEIEWDMGHRVPSHGGQCRHLHGHRYRLRVTCEGPIIDRPGDPADGMLVDFGDLKALMMSEVHDRLDHRLYLANTDPLVCDPERRLIDLLEDLTISKPGLVVFPYIPTAENLARWCWGRLVMPMSARFGADLVLAKVEVWETPTSVAEWVG